MGSDGLQSGKIMHSHQDILGKFVILSCYSRSKCLSRSAWFPKHVIRFGINGHIMVHRIEKHTHQKKKKNHVLSHITMK